MKSKPVVKLLIVLLAGLLFWAFFAFDLNTYLSLSELKARLDSFNAFYESHQWLTMMIYLGIYILVVALSLPGAVIMTLAGGALFGLFTGTILVSFGSTIGATLAFIFSRYIFRDMVTRKFGSRLEAINRGIEKEGSLYLFTLRLVPIFPFFIINLVMGLTSMSTFSFYWVSQLGMLPGTIVYINAGTALASIDSLNNILSFKLLFSFALLGIFPILAKKVTGQIKKRKVYSGFKVPNKFEYNLVVIGAGSAGLVASYIAAAVKAKVALIEAHKMGGDCLNTGCVPSKAILKSAKVAALIRNASKYGISASSPDVSFEDVMTRVKSIIKQVEPHDSVERYTGLGVDCISGYGKILSPFEVQVNDRVLTTRSIIVATGASPLIPDLEGLDQVKYHTSDTIWDIEKLPERMVVLGGGPIGCELAQAFSRLGSKVTIVQRGPQILKREDPEAAKLVLQQFEADGIRVLTGHAAKMIDTRDGDSALICTHDGQEVRIDFTDILIALGRTPNIKGFGLEDLGVELKSGSVIETNEFAQTNFPNIFCSGDVKGTYQFTHTAAHESWYACVNALFGSFKTFRVDYSTIPWATYTEPEVARVGLNETQAKEMDIDHEVTWFDIAELDRAIADSENRGFVKVITPKGKDRILGVTIVGNHAGDIIAEYVLAMKHQLGLNKILGTIHIYPTMAEANKYAAGMWKKNHAPENLLKYVEKFHAWRRR